MISELKLFNYRGFQEFSLSGCSQVNLFVGKNNAGKSSLLEALYLYACRMDIEVLQSIAMRRGEIVEDPRGRDAYTVDLSHFFYGHRIKSNKAPLLVGKTASYTIKFDESERLQPEMGLFQFDDETSLRRPLHTLKIVETRKGDDNDIQEAMLYEHGGVSIMRRNIPYAVAIRRKNQFITPYSLDNQSLARLWNNILVSNEENSIVNALKILDDKVSSIAFLSNEQFASRFTSRSVAGFVVGIDGSSRRVPLGSLGDGMKRLLAIATALASAKGGCLFIDEIDAGFHYSVMADLWKLIIKTAIDNKVQVFASTHSLDCIRGLSVLNSEEMNGSANVFSLYSVDSSCRKATHYSTDEVYRIIRNEIEVRQ